MTESDVEQLALELLQAQGYAYQHGSELERASLNEAVLAPRLRSAMAQINPAVPAAALDQALKEVLRSSSPVLLDANETFHRLLVEGVKIPYYENGMERAHQIWLVDFAQPERNDFLAVNQLTFVENNQTKRPDVILFVNGLPLVVVELKNPANENAGVLSAYRQLQTYKALIPSLFTFNAVLVVSDGLEARAGSISADFERFMVWKTADGRTEAHRHANQLETLIWGMLRRETLLDLVRNFIVFEKTKREDPATGLIQIQTEKKLAAYHQYYAVNKAVESTLRAAHSSANSVSIAEEEPAWYGLPTVKTQPLGDRKGGVVWHTQGSGKSLSMVFYTGKIVQALDNPTILVITDRNDLDNQLFGAFAASTHLLRQPPVQARDREHLKELLRVASGGIVFATIQKFHPTDGGSVFEQLSNRKNIVVIADEAHRTQYGFDSKLIDEKDEKGKVVGLRKSYGFAKYMRDALPNATYIGFTGTPIESADVNTQAVFGNYIDVYDIAQAVEDGATVPIFYESRLAKVNLDDEGRKLLEAFDQEVTEDEELSEQQKAKQKWTQMEAIVGNAARLQNLAKDLVEHFEARQAVFEGKGMFVAMSRRIAVELYNEIVKLRPDWHSDDLTQGAIKVVMTAASSDGPELAKHHTNKTQRESLALRMKNPADSLKLVIVRDMWLTGFDAPCLHTLYIDKLMKGHTLMQAIARVNRVFKDKPGGLVVDYLGIATQLKEALSIYTRAGGKGSPAEMQEAAVDALLEKLEVVRQFYFGFAYSSFFTASTSEKLSMILQAEDHILGLPQGKERYLHEVTLLSKANALATPHAETQKAADEIAFFQTVKARLAKFEPTGGKGRTNLELETAIKQIIDQAIVSDQVIDVFDAAGIKKPDISILSDEFLAEIQSMKHRNLALELLKKILNDEIRARAQHNLVRSKTLLELLENAVHRYQNNLLTTAEIIQELIDIAKDLKTADQRGKLLGLSDDELAFYDALEVNDSAVKILGDKQLSEIARELCQKVRSNATIDWTVKTSARAAIMVMVRRTLNKHGYPPDKQEKATETVMKQAEVLANYFVNED